MPRGVYPRLSAVERLLRRRVIDPVTGCWFWHGKCDKRGYGHIQVEGKFWRVHRLSFVLSRKLQTAPVEDILHDCDNPSCFNPIHLHKGDQRINQKESVDRGRHTNSRKTTCPFGHPYSTENTYSHVTVRGLLHRVCRTCRLQQQRRRFGRDQKEQAISR